MFSSPRQHIVDAMNRICRRSGSELPCLERRTRPSDVTIRLYVGLPVPVYLCEDVLAVVVPDWNIVAAGNVPMYEVTVELCGMIVVVACTLVGTEDTF
jgi:hypothetical protein